MTAKLIDCHKKKDISSIYRPKEKFYRVRKEKLRVAITNNKQSRIIMQKQ